MRFNAATLFLTILAVATSVSEAAIATDANEADVVVAASLDSSAASSVLSANDMHRKLPGDDSDEDEEEEEDSDNSEDDESEDEDEDVEEAEAYQAVEDEEGGDDLEEENEMNMAYVAGAAGSATVIFAALGVLEHRRRVRIKKTPTINLNDNIQTDYVSAANIEIV